MKRALAAKQTIFLTLGIPVIGIGIGYLIPNWVGLALAMLFFSATWAVVAKSDAIKKWRTLELRYRFPIIVTGLASLAVLFGYAYFGLLLASPYLSKHFRVSPDAVAGSGFSRLSARNYLDQKIAFLTNRMKFSETGSEMIDGTNVRNLVQNYLEIRFSGKIEIGGPWDPVKFDKFIRALATEQETVVRDYGNDLESDEWRVGRVLDAETFGCLQGTSIVKSIMTEERYKLQQLVELHLMRTVRTALEYGETEERRALLVSALLFSAMNFLTSGYGDMIPNSKLAMFLLGLHFLVHLSVFVLMLQVVWPREEIDKI